MNALKREKKSEFKGHRLRVTEVALLHPVNQELDQQLKLSDKYEKFILSSYLLLCLRENAQSYIFEQIHCCRQSRRSVLQQLHYVY